MLRNLHELQDALRRHEMIQYQCRVSGGIWFFQNPKFNFYYYSDD